MDDEKEYEITVNRKQAEVILEALSVYSRAGLGHTDAIFECVSPTRITDNAKYIARALKATLFPELKENEYLNPNVSEVMMAVYEAFHFAKDMHTILNNEKEKYHISMYANRTYALVRALDIYSRFSMGQLTFVSDVVRTAWQHNGYRDLADAIKIELFPELERNEYYGIAHKNTPRDAQIAWDLYQVVRHHISWESAGWPAQRDWSTMMGVNYDDPMRTADIPFATMKTISKKRMR